MKSKSILFITPYPYGHAPSQRFRFEQYLTILSQDYKIKQASFWTEESWLSLYKNTNFFIKIFNFISAFINRFLLLFNISKYDFIFIHRESTPIGPPLIEFLIAKVFKKKIIYDFDDAIWLHNVSEKNKPVKYLKANWKVKYICKWAYKVSCGNSFLADYAKKYNSAVYIIPTTIDLDYHELKSKKNKKITIGWTGTHSTMKHLELIVPVISKLEKQIDFSFLVISDKAPNFKLKSLEFIPWNKSTEIEDLNRIDIGIMPLYNSEWEKGKCGFKGLQYMALGIPTVMSSVGVNQEIVNQAKNGFLANNNNEWIDILTSLLESIRLREELGKAGKQTIEDRFSVKSNTNKYLALFS
jgi:glycosyltransferase involved in cell wall biosynthesis